MFAEIANFNKSQLSSTNTIVRQHPCVKEPPTSNHSLKDERDMTEYYDRPSSFRDKIVKLAQAIKESENLVIYTGAGISTSASIPDYRGENGYWTRKDKGEKPPPCKDLAQAIPTVAHMVIRSLVDAGICKLVVSTNIDGLHRRSGIPADKIAELHGNCFKEQCRSCNLEYLRTFNCSSRIAGSHQTERDCEQCGQPLEDTIINFSEKLPEETYKLAEEFSKKADVSLVLGTSMLVAPANSLPVKNSKSKLVIVNRQKTPFDNKSEIRLFGDTDDAMQILMEELGLSIETTVGGYEISIPPVDIEAKYEQFKPKLEKQKRETEQRLSRKGGKFILENIHAEKKNITKDDISPNSLVYIENCSDMECTVENMCAKIILCKCNNVNVSLPKQILTSCLELIHCKNVIVEIGSPIHTLSIDQSSECALRFMNPSHMGSIYSCNVKGLSISPCFRVKPQLSLPVVVDISVDADESHGVVKQYITRLHSGETLLTEEVIREGVGYATTLREKTAAEEKEQRLLSALERVMIADIEKRTQ